MVITLWFADAILFKGTMFTVDTIIIQNIHDEFKFSDVHLQDVLHLEEGPRLDFTVDAILKPPPIDEDFIVDAQVLQTTDLNFQVDANAQIMPSQNYEVDALIKLETDNDFTVDAVIVDRPSLFYTLDSILSSRLVTEFTVDPITLGTLDREFDVDSFLQELNKTFGFTCDAIIDRRAPFLIDSFLLAEGQTFGYTVDAVVVARLPLAYTVDASLQKDGFRPFNVDAIVKAFDQELDYTADAQVVELVGDIDVCTVHFCTDTQPVVFFTVDALMPKRKETEFTVDANIDVATQLNYTVDAFLTKPILFGWTVDANLSIFAQTNACPSQIRESLNCVSIIRRRGLP